MIFLGRESEVTGRITLSKLNARDASKKCIAQNGVGHIDIKKISDCLCSVRRSVR